MNIDYAKRNFVASLNSDWKGKLRKMLQTVSMQAFACMIQFN